METVSVPWVRVVIVAYNAGAWLQRCVDALALQNMGDFQAVLVDNASTDGSVENLRLPDLRFRLLRLPANLGFAAASNRGAQGTRTPWVAMLNPDAIADPHWLDHLRAATLRHGDAVALGSTQLMDGDPWRLDGFGDNYSIYGLAWRGGWGQAVPASLHDTPVLSVCAAAALYRSDLFGFAEEFFCYLEDVDLGLRLRLAGHQVVQVAAAQVRHGGSVITGRHSDFTLFHSTRNGVMLMARCLPLPLLLLALPLYGLAQCRLMIRTPQPLARLRGLMAGLRRFPAAWRQRGPRAVPWWRVARWLVWNPATVSRRCIVPIRPEL